MTCTICRVAILFSARASRSITLIKVLVVVALLIRATINTHVQVMSEISRQPVKDALHSVNTYGFTTYRYIPVYTVYIYIY